MAHRGIPHPSLPSSLVRPLRLRAAITRLRPQTSQVRQLWWWGKYTHKWSLTFDEDFEERFRRHQKIMKYQYSKMLRRRALWDREDNSRLSWRWKVPTRLSGERSSDFHNISSTQAPQTKPDESRDDGKKPNSPFATFHKDYESFKKAVDHAIERDPYGTLFGRRLQSPPSSNNSSWTSFSWIFDPKEIKQDKTESAVSSIRPRPPHPASPSSSRPAHVEESATRSADPSPIPKTQSVATDEYEYDPISMRKVPRAKVDSPPPRPLQQHYTESPSPSKLQKSNPSSETTPESSSKPSTASQASRMPLKSDSEPKSTPKRSFLDALFVENGVDIPVKTYKPHKVYGYGSGGQNKTTQSEAPKKKVGFETNRKHELNSLRLSTLGCTIDTTAEYGGKYADEATSPPSAQPSSVSRDRGPPSEDAPLFSGTTYEGRSQEILKTSQPNSEWLTKEGFRIEERPSGADAERTDIPVLPPKLHNDSEHTKKTVLVEPALDRHNRLSNLRQSHGQKSSASNPTEDRPEDLEFLRASDVRAAARSLRTSKLEKETQKRETRKKLEDDFACRQQDPDVNLPERDDRSVMSKSLDNVWEHVRSYPDGVVARTVRSMGIFNENFKKYVRPEPKVDLNKKLDFKDESLSKVSSIYRPKPNKKSISFSPSKEVLEAERINLARTRTLQNTTHATKKEEDIKLAQADELAEELQKAYEDEFGSISVTHRQVTSPTTKPHPLSTATVKEGVPRYPAVESHVSKFEPEFSKLVDEAKSVRRELHEAKIRIRGLKQRMALTPWSEVKVEAGRNEASAGIAEDTSAQGLDEPVTIYPGPTLRPKPTAPAGVQEPIFTPNESNEWNDEHPPSITELKTALATPIVILEYNAKSDSVARLTAHSAAGRISPAPTPLGILSQLKHFEKFFPFFEDLQNGQYEIISGNSNMLMFQKIKQTPVVNQEQEEAIKTEAAFEASAQTLIPETGVKQPLSPGTTPPPKDAATVLDEIPVEINPFPGPAAPTAPPVSSTGKPTTTPNAFPKPKVKRQEDVFSGTLPPLPSRLTTNPIDPEIASPRGQFHPDPEPENAGGSRFRRLLRTLNRAFFTVLTVGVGAYVVGVVSEGLNAKAQQKGLAAGEGGEIGPRKKIVMTDVGAGRRRPGIFSTEDSR